MRELNDFEIEQVDGAGPESRGGTFGDIILTGSGAFLGFCLTGGNPAGALLGATVGHSFALIIID